MTLVVAPSRLHFGLIHVPVDGISHWPDGTPIRKFGGLGLMLAEPAVQVKVELDRSGEWSATGVLADRALGFARRVWDAACIRWREGVRLTADGPPEHVGLGVGTALGLATARALLMSDIFRSRTTPELATLTGRGERSGIGLNGFDRGGFLFDGGKIVDTDTPALLAREPFPTDWRVVLIRPPGPGAWHGESERAAFRRPRSVEVVLHTTRLLSAIANDVILPAVRQADYRTFCDAIFLFNRTAGEPFAVDQGGAYCGPEVTRLIETVRGWGVSGVGQSSWGPTVFAFASDPPSAEALANRARTEWPSLADVRITAANNSGALSLFLK